MIYWDAGRGAVAKITLTEVLGSDTFYTEIRLFKKVRPEYELETTYTADSLNIKVLNRGDIEQRIDFDNLYLVPSTMNVELLDADKFIYNKIYLDSDYEKDFYFTQKVNGTIVFAGKADVNSLKFDHSSNKLSFTAVTALDRLNKTYLTDTNGDPTNPLQYIDATQYEMHYSGTGVDKEYYYSQESAGVYPKLIQMIKDIYKYADIDDVTFTHNWEFKITQYLTETSVRTVYGDINDIATRPSFFFLEDRFETLGDVLRAIAKSLCSYTGSYDFDSAFFNKHLNGIYYPAPFGEEVKILTNIESYSIRKVDYVRAVKPLESGDYIYHAPSEESFTSKVNDYLETTVIPIMYYESPKTNDVATAKDSLVSDEYKAIGQCSADFWYYLRGDIEKCKTRDFLTPNINIQFSDIVPFGGDYYQTIEMTKKLKEHSTKLTAIKVA